MYWLEAVSRCFFLIFYVESAKECKNSHLHLSNFLVNSHFRISNFLVLKNHPINGWKNTKKRNVILVTRDDDSLFGKEIREAYPNNLLNLNDLKLSDVTKVLAQRNERIFWINLSDRNKDKIWFRELLKQKRNRFKDKCLVVLHMWTYVVVVFVRYIIVRHRSPPSSMP